MVIGDKVKINPNTIPDYFDDEFNPLDVEGVIIKMDDGVIFDFNIIVDFDDGNTNSYNKEHLIKIN